MNKIRVKNNAVLPLTEQARKDWTNLIKIHPDRFDAALYKPQSFEVEDDQPNKPLFAEIDERQQNIAYLDPIICDAVETPNPDDAEYLSSWDASESMGYGDTQVLILRLGEWGAADGSGVEFLTPNEAGEVERQSWYVLRSIAIGSPARGFLHYCIPFGDVESLPELPQGALTDE